MLYTITGTFTFASQAFRDAAVTRVNNALASYTYTGLTTSFASGVNNVGTTVFTISLDVGTDPATAASCASALYSALVSTNRNTSGYMSVNKV